MNLTKKAETNPGKVVQTIFVLVITVYVVYSIIKAFTEADPEFARYGWPILGALVVGIIAYFKSGRVFQ